MPVEAHAGVGWNSQAESAETWAASWWGTGSLLAGSQAVSAETGVSGRTSRGEMAGATYGLADGSDEQGLPDGPDSRRSFDERGNKMGVGLRLSTTRGDGYGTITGWTSNATLTLPSELCGHSRPCPKKHLTGGERDCNTKTFTPTIYISF